MYKILFALVLATPHLGFATSTMFSPAVTLFHGPRYLDPGKRISQRSATATPVPAVSLQFVKREAPPRSSVNGSVPEEPPDCSPDESPVVHPLGPVSSAAVPVSSGSNGHVHPPYPNNNTTNSTGNSTYTPPTTNSTGSSTYPPSNSTRNQTALILAYTLLNASSATCSATGGGCGVFNLTLSDCLDDTCACADDVTLAGMVCAECEANEARVVAYNKYLDFCHKGGMASPNETVEVVLGSPGVSPTSSVSANQSHGSSSAGGNAVSNGSAVNASGSKSSSGVYAAVATSSSASVTLNGSTSSGSSVRPSVVGLLTNMPSSTGLPTSVSAPSSSVYPSLAQNSTSSGDITANSNNANGHSRGGIAGLQLDAGSGSITSASSLASLPAALASTRNSTSHNSTLGSDLLSLSNSTSMGLSPGGKSTTQYITSTSMSTSTFPQASATDGVAGIGLSNGTGNGTTNSAGIGGGSRGSTATMALNAAIAFFSVEIDKKCDKDCGTWRGLSNTCTQDLCICTEAGILSSSACSSCLGTTTHGVAYQSQIGYYNAYTANCSSEVSGSTPAGAGYGISNSGVETVPGATSSRSANANTISMPSPQVSKAGAEDPVVTKYVGVAGRRAVLPRMGGAGWIVVALSAGWAAAVLS